MGVSNIRLPGFFVRYRYGEASEGLRREYVFLTLINQTGCGMKRAVPAAPDDVVGTAYMFGNQISDKRVAYGLYPLFKQAAALSSLVARTYLVVVEGIFLALLDG